MTFLDELLQVPPRERDAWVDRRLGFGELPDDGPDLPAGAVPYLPSAVEEILAMVRELPLRAEDELVDIGSGAGRAVILANLLSGARARGIEVQAGLVKLARERAEALSLREVSFVHANAADLELEGSVFFLYAPANGELLTRVVKRLEAAAKRRRIAVCTVALELRGQPWLRPRRTSCETLTIYESV
ncbi:MAG: methyltransferase domain-containing protein [Deltaproteobacteria bacterium]|nr:methyltransferase domain-containing protein [Deltaproteobacteria bacterium]